MGRLGPSGTAVVALGAVLVVVILVMLALRIRRRRAERARRPRTIADLVRVLVESGRMAPARPAVPDPEPDEPDGGPAGPPVFGSSEVRRPEAVPVREDAKPDDDPPWNRAARMAVAGADCGRDRPAEVVLPSIAPPLLLVGAPSPAIRPVWIAATPEPFASSGWPSWTDVDHEEVRPPRPSPVPPSTNGHTATAATEPAIRDEPLLVRPVALLPVPFTAPRPAAEPDPAQDEVADSAPAEPATGEPDVAAALAEIAPAEPAAAELTDGSAPPVRFSARHRDGTPVPGAAATLLDDRGRNASGGVADLDGYGELPAPEPGRYLMVSTAAGHQPGATVLSVPATGAEAEALLPRSASVCGVVRGGDGPLAGARVTLVQHGELVDAVDTGADGGYRIDDLGAGEYGLSVVAAGCEPVAIRLPVPDEAEIRHDVVLAPAPLPPEDRSDERPDRRSGGPS